MSNVVSDTRFFAERWHTLVWECGALCKHVHEIYYGKRHSEIDTRASRFRNQSDSSIRTSKYLNKPIKLSRVQPLLRVKSISRRLECLSKTSNLFRNFFRRSAKTKQTHHNHRVFVSFFVHLLLTLLSRVSFVLFSFHLYFCIVLTKV